MKFHVSLGPLGLTVKEFRVQEFMFGNQRSRVGG